MEDARRQLGLLLWKNFLLRIRQPVILVLELLWPIIIFVAIMGARWTIPPVDRSTCHYNAWALPSAGAVPFLQSLICNIDNDCVNETQFRDIPSYPNSRIEELIEHVVPLLSDEKLRHFVEILPKGTKLARTLLDILSQHDLRLIITSGLPVDSLLKRNNDTKEFIELYFPPELAEELWTSYIRLPQLLQFMSATSSFCAAEDPVFDFPSVWPQIMQQFCTLNESKQKEFFENIPKHLDVSNIVLMVGNVMSQLGRVDVGRTISRIGTSLQSLSAKYLFPSLFVGDIQPLLNDVSHILSKIQAGHLNIDLLSLIADDAAPLYEGSNFSLLRTLVDQLKRSPTSKNNNSISDVATLESDPMVFNSSPQPYLNNSYQLRSGKHSRGTFSFVQTLGDWLETLMHVLRLLPEEQFAQVTGHKLFAMFRFLVNTVYKIIKTSSKGDFQDFFDLAESVFFTVLDNEKGLRTFEPEFWTQTLCNKTEFLAYLNIPDGINPSSLQEFSCNMSTVIAEVIHRWPLQQGVSMKSTKEETSNLVKMMDFLINFKPRELAHGTNSGIFRARMLRLQLSFSTFLQHLHDKTNLTDSLSMLLRVTHSAFPKSLWSNDFIPTFVHFIHKFSDSLTISNDKSNLPPLVQFIRSMVLSAAETAEVAIWGSLDESTLHKMSLGRDKYCTNHTVDDVLCMANSSLSELKLPQKHSPKKKKYPNSNIDWNQVQLDLRNVEKVLKLAFPSSENISSHKSVLPPTLAAINAGIASVHVFIPKPNCPGIFNLPKSVNSILCHILRFQQVQRSLNQTSHLLHSSIGSLEENTSVFIWKSLLMLTQQIMDYYADQFPDSRAELIDTIDALVLSAQSNSTEIDWENHVRLMFTVVRLVGSQLESDVKGVRSFFHVAQSLVNLIVNRLQHIDSSSSEESNVIQVEDVFPNAPVTEALVRSLFPRLPEVLSTLFWTSLAQGKLHHLASESHRNLTIVTKLLCNETVTDYLYNPSFEGKAQWDSLMMEICSHPYFKVFEEVLEDPDIQTLIFETDNQDDPIEWDEIKQGVMELTSLAIKLSRDRKVDVTVFPSPHLWDELWTNTSKTAQKPSVIIYVLANSIFHPFCNPTVLEQRKIPIFKSSIKLPPALSMSNISELSSALCYMSKEPFAENFVRTWSRPLDSSSFKHGKWRELYDSLMNSTNARPVVRSILGDEAYELFHSIDSLILSEWNFSSAASFMSGFVNVTEHIYNLVDMVTEGNLTNKFAYMPLLYALENFNSFIESEKPVFIEDFIQNKTFMKSLFRKITENSTQSAILHKWLKIQMDYFNVSENLNSLQVSCSSNYSSMEENDFALRELFCANQPSNWMMSYDRNTDASLDDFTKMIGLLSENLNTNRTLYTKQQISIWARSVLQQTLVRLRNFKLKGNQWESFMSPKIYFNVFRASLWAVQTAVEQDTLLSSCPASNWSLMWSRIPNVLMDSIIDAEFLLCKLPTKNISLAYGEISNILSVKDLLREYFKATSSSWSIECPNVHPPWANLTLSWLLSGVDLLDRIVTENVENLKHRKIVKECFENVTSSILFADVSRLGNLTKHITRIISSLSGVGPNRRNWNHIEGEISSFIAQQLPGFSPLSSFSNLTYEMDSSSRTSRNASLEYVLKVLEKSAFNLNWLSQRNFSSESLRASFCHKNTSIRLENIVRLPPHQEAIEEVLHFFCHSNGFERLFSRINMETINKTLQEAQEREFRAGRWFRELFATSSGILDDLARLVQASQQISVSAPTSSKQLVDTIIKISRTTAIQDVMDGLNGIIEKLKNVFRGSTLLQYLQEILHGAQAFQSVQKLKLFKLTIKVPELFPASGLQESFSGYLQKSHNLSTQEVKDFLDADFDITRLSQVLDHDKSTRKCPEKESPESSKSLDSSVGNFYLLCNLFTEFQLNVSPDDLRDLVLGKLLKNAGELGLQGVLSQAGMDLTEVQQMMNLLGKATELIPDLESRLQKLISVLGPNMKEQLSSLKIAEHGIASLASPEALSASGSILCGKPLKTLNHKFSLLSLGDNPEVTVDTVEVESLPNEFCQNAYKQMLKLPGGPILWGFLKPVFRGKILYAPKYMPAADAVIRKLNATFDVVTKYIQLLQAVAVGTTGLNYLEHKKELVQSIQVLLSSKQVSKIIGLDGALVSGILGSGGWSKPWSGDEKFGTTVLEVMTLIGNVSQCITLNRFVGYDTEAELEKAAMMLHEQRQFIAAVVFLEDKDDPIAEKTVDQQLPQHIKYKIRMDIDNVPTAKEIKRRWWHPYPFDNFLDDFRYFRGFIQLQELIDSAILKLQMSNNVSQIPFKKYLQQFPYPCHQQDKFGGILKGSLSGVMTVSWIFLIAFLVRDKVLERELSLQDILDVMGLNPIVAWLSWFLTGLATISVSVCGIVVIMKWGGITPMTDPFILFLFILLYAILLISFCYLMSVIFQRASTAALMSVLCYILSFFPFLLFVTWEVYFVFWQKIGVCMLIATSFCFGTLYLNRLEEQGTGVQWDNLWISPIPDDSMNMGFSLVAMTACTILYFAIAVYISQVKKGKNRRAKVPWYLVAIPSSLSSKSPAAQKSSSEDITDIPEKARSQNKEESVSIRNLHVTYQGRKPNEEKEAVCGLSLGLQENQITTLLGHNGAGKTTTIKVLTGRLHPNAGDIQIYGYPIPEGLASARKLIGYCPQYNTLFAKLTVKEHLYLFAQLKGVLSGPQLDSDVNDMLSSLGLQKKQDDWTENLSGGQRRRLCVGMAFVGGSKFIVLDEPTSSVDPLARRSIWDLIEQYKSGRTILLTTHHLDEADILSDHIVVLHKGKVLCQGSPLALKSKFGSGYKLNLLASSSSLEGPDEDDSGNASSLGSSAEEEMKDKIEADLTDCNGLLEFIQKFIPSANLLENGSNYLVVSLPQIALPKSDQSECLSQFFQELDIHLQSFGFKNYTLTSTSLEEVFLTLCRVEDAKRQFYKPDIKQSYSPVQVYKSLQRKSYLQNRPKFASSEHLSEIALQKEWNADYPSSNRPDNKSDASIPTLEGYQLVYNQFKGLLRKRFWHTKRNWKIMICSVIMPCLFIALAMALSVSRPARRAEPKLLLNPQLYKSQKTDYTISFVSSDEWTMPRSRPLLESLIATNDSKHLCYDFEPGKKCGVDLFFDNSKEWCLCKNKEHCLAPDEEILPVAVQAGQNIFYNLSGQNLPRHLLSNYIKFNEKRYGGWTIMHKRMNSLSMKNDEDDSPIVKVWFDNSGYHAAPSYLNALHNAILRSSLQLQNQTGRNYGITTYSHPMQISAEQLSQETLLQRLGEIGIAYVFLVGLSLIPAASSVYLVREASLEEKRVQIAAGIHPLLYWMTHLVWDLMSLLLTASLASLVIHAFNLAAFVYRLNLAAVVSLILCFGWSSITMMYIATRLFKEGSLAFMVLFTSNTFVGLVVMLIVLSLHMLNISSDAEQALYIVKRLSLIFPQWSLLGGLTSLAQNQLQTDIFQIFGQDTYGNPFSWNLLLPNYIALLVEGVLFFCINIALEVGAFTALFRFIRSRNFTPGIRKRSKTKSDGLIRLQNVSKVYQSRLGRNYAVNDLSLSIFRGECFGLIGANGAGKTTLFRMLSGQMNPTEGTIDIGNRWKNKTGFLGYCPQADALDELLTPREHLKLYATFKGIHPVSIDQVVEEFLASFDLSGHSECPAKALSGGTKRKLCTAIAMIGSPLVVLLDEPTSGMDPATRRLVWTSIMNITTRKQKAAVVLSSHSIEECDILCSRIGIMVNGQIQCLGTPQELKSLHGNTIQISFRAPTAESSNSNYSNIFKYIKTKFPSAQLKGQHCTTIEFSICKKDLPLWKIIEELEEGMLKLNLQDISLNHTTLDQVFVGFVQQQSDGVLEQPICVCIGDESEKETTFSIKSYTNSGYSTDNGSSCLDNQTEICTRL